jgi:hypothetical protein
MISKIYKFYAFSLVIINFWTLYGFFDYYTADENSFSSLDLYLFYIFSFYFAIGMGLILLLIRASFYFKNKINIVKNNFFYIFCSAFNFNLFVIYLICTFLNVLRVNTEFIVFPISTLLISSFIFVDIYKSNFNNQSESWNRKYKMKSNWKTHRRNNRSPNTRYNGFGQLA